MCVGSAWILEMSNVQLANSRVETSDALQLVELRSELRCGALLKAWLLAVNVCWLVRGCHFTIFEHPVKWLALICFLSGSCCLSGGLTSRS